MMNSEAKYSGFPMAEVWKQLQDERELHGTMTHAVAMEMAEGAVEYVRSEHRVKLTPVQIYTLVSELAERLVDGDNTGYSQMPHREKRASYLRARRSIFTRWRDEAMTADCLQDTVKWMLERNDWHEGRKLDGEPVTADNAEEYLRRQCFVLNQYRWRRAKKGSGSGRRKRYEDYLNSIESELMAIESGGLYEKHEPDPKQSKLIERWLRLANIADEEFVLQDAKSRGMSIEDLRGIFDHNRDTVRRRLRGDAIRQLAKVEEKLNFFHTSDLKLKRGTRSSERPKTSTLKQRVARQQERLRTLGYDYDYFPHINDDEDWTDETLRQNEDLVAKHMESRGDNAEKIWVMREYLNRGESHELRHPSRKKTEPAPPSTTVSTVKFRYKDGNDVDALDPKRNGMPTEVISYEMDVDLGQRPFWLWLTPLTSAPTEFGRVA